MDLNSDSQMVDSQEKSLLKFVLEKINAFPLYIMCSKLLLQLSNSIVYPVK